MSNIDCIELDTLRLDLIGLSADTAMVDSDPVFVFDGGKQVTEAGKRIIL